MFKDRLHAGRELAKKLRGYRGRDVIVLAIPRGGVPVAYSIALELNAVLDVIVPRKIPIPWNPEAGFGAVTVDGEIVLNKDLVSRIGLEDDEIKELAGPVIEEIKRRIRIYRGDKKFLDLGGETVIIVDDGLASGYTMLSAIKSVRRETPKELVVAVPVGPLSSVKLIEPLVDDLVCLVVEDAFSFAVASFYDEFPDLSDDEVIQYLTLVKLKK